MKTADFTKSHVDALVIMEHAPGLSITINETRVGVDGYCLAWCEDCTDGLNSTRDECDFWIASHAKKRHGWE